MPKKADKAIRKPSLGFALIAKDAEHHLGACLESIRPIAEQIVVCVDERTTDKTARVAKKYGAQAAIIAVGAAFAVGSLEKTRFLPKPAVTPKPFTAVTRQ